MVRKGDGMARETEAALDEPRGCTADADEPVALIALDGDKAPSQGRADLEALLGYEPGALSGTPLPQLAHPEDAVALDCALARAMEEPDAPAARARFRCRQSDGSWHPVAASVRGIPGQTAERLVVACIQDIAGTAARQASWRQERRLLRTIVDSVPGLVYAKDLAGRKTFANRADLAVMGLAREEDALGKTDADVYPLDVAATFRASDQRVLERGEPVVGIEETYRDESGETHWLLSSKVPVRDEQGRVVGLVGAGHDITDRKRSEEALREAQEQLAQARRLETVGRLAGGVAHEFNNLLATISGHGDRALASLGKDHPGRRHVRQVLDAADAAASIVRQMLTFSRSLRVTARLTDLAALVERARWKLAELVGDDVDIVADTGDGPALVRLDPQHIEQALTNLTLNAREAMPLGGRLLLRAEVTSLADLLPDSTGGFIPPGQYVVLTVGDTGTGVPEDARMRLFEPFFTTKPTARGRGLGLAVVYGIVQQGNGHIVLETDADAGTTWRLYFPAADASSEPPTEDELHGSESILVVQSDPALRSITVEIVRDLGYKVLTAVDAPAALRLLERPDLQVDLLVTDAAAPSLRGHALAAEICAQRPATRVVYLMDADAASLTVSDFPIGHATCLWPPLRRAELAHKLREALAGPPYSEAT